MLYYIICINQGKQICNEYLPPYCCYKFCKQLKVNFSFVFYFHWAFASLKMLFKTTQAVRLFSAANVETELMNFTRQYLSRSIYLLLMLLILPYYFVGLLFRVCRMVSSLAFERLNVVCKLRFQFIVSVKFIFKWSWVIASNYFLVDKGSFSLLFTYFNENHHKWFVYVGCFWHGRLTSCLNQFLEILLNEKRELCSDVTNFITCSI